ncbi:DNA polymerase [Penaeus vannamei nudivirus]|nr:DNA polymerase [Penaeus vannamei nucleopolyhedrovirus]
MFKRKGYNQSVLVDSNSKDWLSTIPNAKPKEFLYILDWIEDSNDYYGVGINKQTKSLQKFKVTNINHGVYVWALDESMLRALLVNFDTILSIDPVKTEKTYTNNNVTIIDDFMGTGRYNDQWKMFKLTTANYLDGKKLHYLIMNNVGISTYISTIGQWDLTSFMMMEFHARNRNFIYATYINEALEYSKETEAMKLLTAVYDIETVSNYDHRIPLGNYHSDHIMSVTLIVGDTVYTLFNLPLENNVELQSAKSKIDKVSTEEYYKVKNRQTFMFNSENDLLSKLFSLFEEINEVYICLGYNSRNYDMPFLLSRAVYLGMPHVKNFYYMNGILSYGKNMLHLDLHQIIVKYFATELSSFSLKNVGKALLDDINTQKLDFNARNLRYVYKFILEHGHTNNGIFNNELCNQQNKWSIDLANMAKYNEMDCLVVLALWDKLQYEDFINYASRVFFIPFTRLGLSKLKEYLSTNMIYESLQRNTIVTYHPDVQMTKNAEKVFALNTEIVASSDANKKAFNGGFNERKRRGYYPKVYAMDARAYYPELISGMNLSHETVSLLRIKDLLALTSNYDKDFDEYYKIIKFCTHKSMNEYALNGLSANCKLVADYIASTAYVDSLADNCPHILYKDLNLYNPNDKVVVIHKKQRGILSLIIEERNSLRNLAKRSKNSVKSIIDQFENILDDFKTKEFMNAQIGNTNDDEDADITYSDDENEDGEDLMDDDQDITYSDEEDDEDDGEDSKDFNIEKCKIERDPNQSEASYMVMSQVKLLSKKDFEKLDNKIEALSKYIEYLQNDFTRLNSHYRNMKLLNNSIYGLLGASYGTIKAKNLAAIVTMLGRYFIIAAAHIGKEINGDMMYSDTDSVFFSLDKATVKNPDDYIVRKVNALNANVVLNSKVYKHVYVLCKKTYIATCGESIFSRGINKNGPSLWKVMMERFYVRFIKNQEPLTFGQVSDILYDMYMETYETFKTNNEVILRTLSMKDRDSYKKATASTKLVDRINREYPDYKFDSKFQYFNIIIGDISATHYALDIELPTTPLDKINLYQFYSNIVSTYHSIFDYAISQTMYNNNEIVIKYSIKDFKDANKYAFMKAREATSRTAATN